MFGHTNQPFSLSRDVRAVIIPAGEELQLRAGTSGFITQALGGNYTVTVNGKKLVKHTPKAEDSKLQQEGGAIALQAHDPGSEVHYKNIRIKPLN